MGKPGETWEPDPEILAFLKGEDPAPGSGLERALSYVQPLYTGKMRYYVQPGVCAGTRVEVDELTYFNWCNRR